MATISVSSAAQLMAALRSAQGGDTVVLAGGNYGNVSLSSLNFSSDVTITSRDPGNPAVLGSLSINGSSHIHFDGVNVTFVPNATTVGWSSAVMIDSSRSITFSDSTVKGGPAVNGVPQSATMTDATNNVIGLPAGRAFTIQNSSDVKIEHSDISEFDRGIVLAKSERVTVSENDVHDLRRTAILGTADDLVIEGNHLHDAHPWRWGLSGGDHADFIALYTSAGQATATSDVVIANNVMEQGEGTAILGMWMQGGGAGFREVVIEGNVILGGDFQGIKLSDVAGGSIVGNVLLQAEAGDKGPSILLTAGVSKVEVDGNYARVISDYAEGATGNRLLDNVLVQTSDHNASGYYAISFASELAGALAEDVYAAVTPAIKVLQSVAGPAVTASSLLKMAASGDGIAVVGTYNAEALTGGAGNDTITGNGGADTMSGGSGDDYYYVPNLLPTLLEGVDGGIDTVVAKGNYTLGANLENLVISDAVSNAWSGTGNELNNVIIGSSGNNRLSGLVGNDTLDGGLGADTLFGDAGDDVLLGGGGDDLLTGGAGADQFVLASGFGSDSVTDFSYSAGDRVKIIGDTTFTTLQVGADTVVKLSTGDELTLKGVSLSSLPPGWIVRAADLGGAASRDVLQTPSDIATPSPAPVLEPAPAVDLAPISIAPGALSVSPTTHTFAGSWKDEHVIGTSGADTISGRGGADTLAGGSGDDTYIVPNALSTLIEAVDGGIDTVIARGDHVLAANIENLQISTEAGNHWAGAGNELANKLMGNTGNNCLDGRAGNDTLDGESGADTLLGGEGNDVLLGGAGSDVLTGGAGADQFVLASGFGSDQALDFSFADGDRVKILGDATYATVQVGADTVVRLGTGDQLTLKGVSLANLPSGWVVRAADLESAPIAESVPHGALSVNATTHAFNGSWKDEYVIGTSGADTISGRGGADTIAGGAGDDTYILPNALSTLIEAVDGGIDTVIARGDHVLAANIENLQISTEAGNHWSGTGNELGNRLTGNAGNNRLSGLAGNDTLDGGSGSDILLGGDGNDLLIGGAGSDTLTGGGGADIFTMTRGGGKDHVTDFSYAEGDRIVTSGLSDYTAKQLGAHVVVDFGKGDQLIVDNTSLSSLGSGWMIIG